MVGVQGRQARGKGRGMDEDWGSVRDSGRVSEREGAGRGRGLREGREMVWGCRAGRREGEREMGFE